MKERLFFVLVTVIFICVGALFFTHVTRNYQHIVSVGQPGDVWMVNDEGNLAPLGVDLTGQGRGEVTHWRLKQDLMVLGDATVFLQTDPGEFDWKAKDRLELMYDGKAWREVSRYRPEED